MLAISPETIYRGNSAWEKSLTQITKLTNSPIILGRGIQTNNLRNNIFNDDQSKFIIKNLRSISFNFPDPWFKKRHNKRRVIQTDLINILSNLLQSGSLIFIKTDVKELFDYMDCTISSNFNFKKIDKKDFNYFESFNPNQVKTNREKYAIINQLDIFERIYIKN